MNPDQYPTAAKAELANPGPLAVGASGIGVKRVQEWLSYHGCATAIDSEFGTATQAALQKLRQTAGLSVSGALDQASWNKLIDPMRQALADGTGSSLVVRIKSVAAAHLAVHPREFGGDNCGPWVRMYTGGFDGVQWKWCAGFVTFVIKQACAELGVQPPIAGSLSCDTLAAQSKLATRFHTSESVSAGNAAWGTLGHTYVFLVRNEAGDWIHTGLGFDGAAAAFQTIEGNTNDDGSQNGYEVCGRTRSAGGKDFISLS